MRSIKMKDLCEEMHQVYIHRERDEKMRSAKTSGVAINTGIYQELNQGKIDPGHQNKD